MADAAVPIARPATALARLMRRKLALIGLAIILTVTLGAIFAPSLAPYSPDEQLFDGLTIEGAPLAPNGSFLFGTDLLGRDLLSRILYGARTSLIIGVVANGAALIIGTLIGVTAGFFRGWIGAVLMRFTDLMMAFPALLLAICLAAIFLPSFLLLGAALPFWESLRRRTRIRASLSGVNAAVVGLLLAVFYTPVWTSTVHDASDFAAVIVAAVLLAAWRLPPWLVVLLAAVAGFFGV